MQGWGLCGEVQGPSPACSEVQEVGVLEASSQPDVRALRGAERLEGQRPGRSCPFLSSRSPAGWAIPPQASGWVAGCPSGSQVAGSKGQKVFEPAQAGSMSAMACLGTVGTAHPDWQGLPSDGCGGAWECPAGLTQTFLILCVPMCRIR